MSDAGLPFDDGEAQRLLARRQVAELFRRQPRTISEWCKRGLLKPIRIGRALFFRREDIERLLDAQ